MGLYVQQGKEHDTQNLRLAFANKRLATENEAKALKLRPRRFAAAEQERRTS